MKYHSAKLIKQTIQIFVILKQFTILIISMKTKIIQNVFLSALLFCTVSVQSQTFVKVMIDQAEELEVIADELFYETTNSIILGESVTVQGGTLPYQYLWYKDSEFIGNTLIMETSNLSAAESFTLVVTDAENCTYSMSSNQEDIDEDKEDLRKIEIFPIPASDFIIINPNNINEKLDVTLYDNKGSRVLIKQITDKSIINTDLPSGIYLLKIENDNKEIFELIKIMII